MDEPAEVFKQFLAALIHECGGSTQISAATIASFSEGEPYRIDVKNDGEGGFLLRIVHGATP